jgi:hypothetical protein
VRRFADRTSKKVKSWDPPENELRRIGGWPTADPLPAVHVRQTRFAHISARDGALAEADERSAHEPRHMYLADTEMGADFALGPALEEAHHEHGPLNLWERGEQPTKVDAIGDTVQTRVGLSEHSVAVARRIARLTSDVGRRVKDQSAATRLSLGA